MKPPFRSTLFALLLLPSLSQAQGDTDYAQLARDWNEVHYSGMRAVGMITYAADDEQRARGLRDLERIAMRGSAHAAEQLGYGYLTGAHGIPVDLALSRRFYEMSVRQEDPVALLDYGLLLLSGHRFEADGERGQALVLRAAQLGYPTACVFLMEQLDGEDTGPARAQAGAWRRGMGEKLDDQGRYIDDEKFRSQSLAYGYAQLSQYMSDDIRVPADADRALLYASKVPEEARGATAALMASQFTWRSNLRADHKRARALFENAIGTLSNSAINNYAWLLSTSPDAEVRDGELAVTLMEDLLGREARRATWVDTLAAAHAETGNFEKALELQNEALAGMEKQNYVYDEAVFRRDGYLEGRAWRE